MSARRPHKTLSAKERRRELSQEREKEEVGSAGLQPKKPKGEPKKGNENQVREKRKKE
jgi:hypothetical protein